MDEDLKIVISSVLEADEEASAQRITAQLPNIARLINNNSSIKVGVELDSKGVRADMQNISKELSQAAKAHNVGMRLNLDDSSIKKLQAELNGLKVNPEISRAMTTELDRMGIQIDKISGRWEKAADQEERMLNLSIQGTDQTGHTVSYLQTYDTVTGEINTTLTNITMNLEKQRQIEEQIANKAKADNDSRIAFLEKQKQALADIQASYTGKTSVKPVEDASHLQALTDKYSEINAKIERMIAETGNLDKTQRASVTGMIAELSRLAKEYQNVEYAATKLRTKNVIEVKNDEQEKLTQYENELKSVGVLTENFKTKIEELRTQLSTAFDRTSLVEYLNAFDRLNGEVNTYKAEMATANQAQKLTDSIDVIGSHIDLVEAKFQALNNQPEKLATRVSNLRTLFTQFNEAADSSEKIRIFEELQNQLRLCEDQISNINQLGRLTLIDPTLDTNLKKAEADLETVARQWSALKKDPGLNAQLINLRTQLKNIDNPTALRNWRTEFNAFKSEVKATGRNVMTLGDIFKNNLGKVMQWVSATTLLFRAFRLLKSAIQTIVDLDTAMVDLRKVTDETEESYRKFYLTANETAKALGVTTEALISQTAEWARLGYGIRDAAKMAENSAIFTAISPELNMEEATDGLISVMKAFNYDADYMLDGVISKINKIGNEMAVSNKDLVEVMTRSSSAMKAANNNFEETIALATAAIEITRDSSAVGNALKTVSMRIRGIDEETEELSDGLTEITGKVADLTKVASNNNKGVSLFEAGDPDTYRSTYAILQDISKIWNEMTDKNQAELLETLFGKRQGQVGSAILSNFSSAEIAIEKMANATGNAEKEMEKVYNSLEYKLNALKETWVGVSQNLVNDDGLKLVVDGLTGLSNIVDFLTEHLGLLGTIGIAGTITWLIRLRSTVNTIQSAIQPVLQSLAGVSYDNSAASAVRYASALSSLTPIQRELAMSTLGLNVEQQKQIASMMEAIAAIEGMTVAEFNQAAGANINANAESLMTAEILRAALANGQLTQEMLQNVIAANAQRSAMAGLGATAATTGNAVKTAGAAMMTNPVGWITLLIGLLPLAVTGIKNLYDWLVVTSEEAYESAEEFRNSYEDTQKEVESLNSELETNKDRISELKQLSESGAISIIEQEELERLQQTNSELETTIARKKELAALDAADANKGYVESFNKKSFSDVDYDVLLTERDSLNELYGELFTDYQLGNKMYAEMTETELQAIEQYYNRWVELWSDYGPLSSYALFEDTDYSTYIEDSAKAYRNLVEQQESGVKLTEAQKTLMEQLRERLILAADDIEDNFLGKYIGEDENTEEWKRLLDIINQNIYAAEYFTEKINDLPSSCKKSLEDAGKSASLTKERVEALAEEYPALATLMEDTGFTAEEVAAHFNSLAESEENAGNKATDTVATLVNTLSQLDTITGNVDSISKALGEFIDDGIVSISTLNGMADELKNLSGFEDFVNTLSNSASTTDEVQIACNRLAEEYINTSNILDKVNEETAQAIEGHLTEISVVNAHELVQAKLNAIKWEAKLAEEGLSNATWADVEAHLQAAGAEATEIKQLKELRTAQYNAQLATIDFTNATAAQIGALVSQANAAGIAAEKISYLERVQSLIAAKEAGTLDKYLTDLYGRDAAMMYSTTSGFQSLIDSYVKRAQVDLSDVNVTVPTITVTPPDKTKKKEIEEYIATIDRFREAQEALRKEEEKRERIENQIDNAGSLEERIRLRKELIDTIKAEQNAQHNLNNLRDAAIQEDADRLRGMGFDIEYDPDNNQFWVKNLEYINELTAKSKGGYDTLQEATNAYRKEAESLIGTLDDWNTSNRENSADWLENERAKFETIIENYEDITKSLENAISMRDKWVSDAIEKQDTTTVESYTREIVDYYQQMQENIHEQADYYRSQGYTEDSDEVAALKTLWWDYADNIKEAKNNVIDYLTDIVDASHNALDEIQGAYDTFQKAADEYAQYGGYLTIDTYQEILKLGPQYLQLLMDENGSLVMEEEAIQAVIAARTEQLALDNAMTYVERLRLAATGESMESLDGLLDVTELTTDATWGLVKAKLALMKADGLLSDAQYDKALHNIESMAVMAQNAIEGINNSVENSGDLLKYVMDMVKSNVEQEIDDIERMKDEFAEIIDLRKKSLDAAKDEADYQKDIASKIKEMAKLQARIDALSLDDSREAQAERAKLLEEMNGLQEELSDKQADYAIDNQKEALDKMQEDYEDTQDARIKDLEDSISSEQKLYDMAVEYIKNNWETLLSDLTNWNYEFGSDLTTQIETAWENGIKAAQNYFSYVSSNDVTGKDYVDYYESTNQGGTGGTGGSGGKKNTTVANTKPTEKPTVYDYVEWMKRNGAKWGSASEAERERLHQENVGYAKLISKEIGQEVEFHPDGAWYLKDGRLLYDVYKRYHTGGIVGGGGVKSNEEIALLKDKEWVLNEEMVENLQEQMDRINALSKAFTKLPQYERAPILSELEKLGGGTVSNVTNNNRPVEIRIGDTVIQGGASAATVAQHRQVTREQVNEIARIIGVRL